MKHYSSSFHLALLFVLGGITACHEESPVSELRKPETESSQQPATTPRQKAIQLLASRLRWYHDTDSLAAAKPNSTDGDILDIGKRRFVFRTRAALRADLNRVLDSLRRTGPLVMGSVVEATDTVSYKGPSVHSVQTH